MHTLSALRAGKLASIKRLDLCCGLDEFPREIFDLADTLEILNLSGNALSTLPDDLPGLHRLRVIFCSDNRFESVPAVLGRCPNLEMIGFKANRIRHLPAAALPPKLRWLILTDNQLAELPPELGHCRSLQKLMLAGNRLHRLPEEMAACSRLELLRIAANRFEQLPDWLPALPRLAWLAYAGNPCSDRHQAAAMHDTPANHIDWHTLTLQHVLGEGASGVIYRAEQSLRQTAVAVKLFKGALTSDGLPRNEKAANLAAGLHPNLIPIKGRITGHPDGATGLVMSLVAPEFVSLAGPPSLDSCTRDIYPPGTVFTAAAILNLALGIASVAAHLHAQGIMHGDLYAHNILWNRKNECLLGDFGAASFLPLTDAALTARLQRIEVRAYGCLLEELLNRCAAAEQAFPAIAALRELQQRCLQETAERRPLFSEIRDIQLARR